MKKILCICNTYYQLIFSMQLRKTLYREDYFAVLLSDHSKGAVDVCCRLKQTQFFDEVHYAETKQMDYSLSLNPMKGKDEGKHIISILGETVFDELLTYNFSKSTYFVFSCLYKKNKNIKTYKYEEGVLSYNTHQHELIPLTWSYRINRLIYFLRKLIRCIDIKATLQGFYCYYPSIYKGALSPVQVPLIAKDGGLGEVIVKALAADTGNQLYREKYIFFTSVYDFEGGEAIGELALARKIADVVGKENLLIKVHPRDTRTVYADEGFHIDTNSAIPFEALLFAYDFSDKILLTATSGAVLSASIMLENPPETYYMYPLCKLDGNPIAKGTVSQIDQLLGHESLRKELKKIHVCDCINEIVR